MVLFVDLVFHQTEEESISPKRKAQEEPNVTFQDLLWQYYETRSELGKPFYNYRPVTEIDGTTKYKAQLIMGGKVTKSELHATQSDAANEAARKMFIEVHPNANEIISKMNRYVEKVQLKKKVKEDNEVYFSDDEMQLPSYEQKLRELLIELQCPDPVFTYQTGDLGGFLCSGVVLDRSAGKMQTMVSLREHSSKATAREDVSHDLYVVLLKKSD
jgi:hypothetical protein